MKRTPHAKAAAGSDCVADDMPVVKDFTWSNDGYRYFVTRVETLLLANC
jgi:hypothetical protein